ncbi:MULTISPECIES: EamA family transporter [unclassified Peribacillus]|uniref:EamA family transporter n=1 Tax=unclassified Peribacillus TaxID=2675266 RepID=UPI0036708CA6
MFFSGVSSTYAVIYLGLFPTVIPYFALAYITSKVGASEATSSLYLTPAVALIISWLLLGEFPTMLALGGGGLTLVGVSLSNLNIKSKTNVKNKRQDYVDL